MKFIRVLKAADIQPKIEEYITIIDNLTDSSEFEGYGDADILLRRSKINLLDNILFELEQVTTLDSISKNLFEQAKNKDDYEDARNQFKVILNRADSDKVLEILNKHL